MHNVTYELDGDTLILKMDVSASALAAAPPSASGKTMLVATTSGAMPIPLVSGAPLSVSLNVTTKAAK